MEKTEEQIRLFVFLNILHPFLGAADHLFELDTFPYGPVKPVWDGGSDHAEDNNLRTSNIMNGVGVQTGINVFGIGLTVRMFFFDDIGAQQWTTYLTNPFVVDLMAWLNVVVSHRFSVILHVVDDLCCQVLILWHHVIRPIDTGLTLQNISVVDE